MRSSRGELPGQSVQKIALSGIVLGSRLWGRIVRGEFATLTALQRVGLEKAVGSQAGWLIRSGLRVVASRWPSWQCGAVELAWGGAIR